MSLQTNPTIPKSCSRILGPLLKAVPFADSMPTLLATPRNDDAASKVAGLTARPDLAAGLWLYVDELDRAHEICQAIHTPTGSLWHAIVHRREGDYNNGRYWLRQAGSHPAMDLAECKELIDLAERAAPDSPRELLELQRAEWLRLFAWCVEEEAE